MSPSLDDKGTKLLPLSLKEEEVTILLLKFIVLGKGKDMRKTLLIQGRKIPYLLASWIA